MITLKSYMPPVFSLIDNNCSLLSASVIEEGHTDYQSVFGDKGYLPYEAL